MVVVAVAAVVVVVGKVVVVVVVGVTVSVTMWSTVDAEGTAGRDASGLKGQRQSKLLGELDRGRIGRDGGLRLGQRRPVGVLHLARLAGYFVVGPQTSPVLKVVLGFAMPSALGIANSVEVDLQTRVFLREGRQGGVLSGVRARQGGQADHVVGTDDESAALVGLIGQQ